jgi:hypothetical protein
MKNAFAMVFRSSPTLWVKRHCSVDSAFCERQSGASDKYDRIGELLRSIQPSPRLYVAEMAPLDKRVSAAGANANATARLRPPEATHESHTEDSGG